MLCRYGLSTPDRNCSANIALFLLLHGYQIICIRLWGLLLKTFVETTLWLMAECDHETHLLHCSGDIRARLLYSGGIDWIAGLTPHGTSFVAVKSG